MIYTYIQFLKSKKISSRYINVDYFYEFLKRIAAQKSSVDPCVSDMFFAFEMIGLEFLRRRKQNNFFTKIIFFIKVLETTLFHVILYQGRWWHARSIIANGSYKFYISVSGGNVFVFFTLYFSVDSTLFELSIWQWK